jgi:V/A-type H+-transporting ATPase subunit G/H
MDEKLIAQVLQIEERAQEIQQTARREAEQLPVQAEKEAQALIERARSEAEEEARRMVASAQGQDDSARIAGAAEEKSRQLEILATSNLDRAVAYVLERVAGRG